ncbi:hypothetical protein ElyMa_003127000 [Elysia marginata]|uniref:Uncharacterized protein n=1 Tax=Elysia marginata TaxID=1093978 RepID=A0AAV4IUH1_9GAST|nr:hypothetical protein ElyMa_003127000 [Elysia marginata]
MGSPTCGNSGRTCIDSEATCVGNKCVCKKQLGLTRGKGDFRCYPQNVHKCEIKSDPSLITFNGETSNFPFPCRYLATHVSTFMKDKAGNHIGLCETKIYGFNRRVKGKWYVYGFDATVRLDYDTVPPKSDFISSFRHYGVSSSYKNTVGKSGVSGQWDSFTSGNGGVPYLDHVNGVKILFTWDNVNNRFVYTVEGCGIQVTHVPFDTHELLKQKQVPGLSISVHKDNEPMWLSMDKVMCLAPKKSGGHLFKDIKEATLNIERSLLLRAFRSSTAQK